MTENNSISFGLNLKKKQNITKTKSSIFDKADYSDDDNIKTKEDQRKLINEKIKREQEANMLKVNKIKNFIYLKIKKVN